MLKARALFTATLIVVALTSCAPLPSDPVGGPPVGLRIDDSVISVLVPSCPTYRPLSVEVIPTSASSPLPAAWKASGLEGTLENGVIELAAKRWRDVEGDYSALREFDVVIELEQGSTGAAVWPPITVEDLQDLPSGVFLVNGQKETVEEYVALLDADYPCESQD